MNFKPFEEITYGADPEFFVQDGNTLVSAHDLIPGTKANPFKVPGGAIQVDGVALEFNIDPTRNEKVFVQNVRTVFLDLKSRVKEKLPRATFLTAPVAKFQKKYFESLPPEVKILGCDPDYNAYTGAANPAPEITEPWRTASGHIHIGWTDGADPYDPEHFEHCRAVVRQLDETLHRPMSIVDGQNAERQQFYGAPGAFRPKTYGVEYRVLSNYWLEGPFRTSWVFRQTKRAMRALYDGQIYFNPEADAYNPAGRMYDGYNYDEPYYPGAW